jgi:hypothetical protein
MVPRVVPVPRPITAARPVCATNSEGKWAKRRCATISAPSSPWNFPFVYIVRTSPRRATLVTPPWTSSRSNSMASGRGFSAKYTFAPLVRRARSQRGRTTVRSTARPPSTSTGRRTLGGAWNTRAARAPAAAKVMATAISVPSEPRCGSSAYPVTREPRMVPTVLATVSRATSRETPSRPATRPRSSGNVEPIQVVGSTSTPNAARARTSSRPDHDVTLRPAKEKSAGSLSQRGSVSARASPLAARPKPSAAGPSLRSSRWARAAPNARHDQEHREHQAEGVGAVADQQREQVGADDLGREDQEARGEREEEQTAVGGVDLRSPRRRDAGVGHLGLGRSAARPKAIRPSSTLVSAAPHMVPRMPRAGSTR